MRISRVVYPTPNTPSLEEDIRREQEGANGFTRYPLPLSHVILDVLCILLSLLHPIHFPANLPSATNPHDSYYLR